MPGETDTVDTVETKAAFARRLGISRQAVGKHASTAGFPVDASGNVRVKAALDWLESNIKGHGAETDETSDGGIIAARISLLKVQTARQELALAHERGELIAYTEARRALMGFMRLNKDAFLNFGIRHGPAIASEVGCDESALISALSIHLRNALEEACNNRKPFLPAQDEGQ